MPATERHFRETPPPRLYLDTDVLVSALVRSEPHHTRCADFLRRLHRPGLTTLYVSPLSWAEFADVVMWADFRERLQPEARARLRLAQWQQALVRQTYLRHMVGFLDQLLSQFAWAEVPLTRAVRQQAVEFMGQYALRGNDALHLAAMTHADILDLASLDEKFRRVDGLWLWNDRVHAPPRGPAAPNQGLT